MLEFLASEKAPALAELGTSCPDHFLRTKVKPMILDLPADASVDDAIARLGELHEAYRADYTAYYEAHADAESPAIRGADPLIVLVPGVGMFSFGANKQTARVAGEFYINAINVMRGAEALSTYSPISDAEKFRIEYWALEEAKLQRMPKPKSHQGRVAFVTGAASGIGKAIATRLAAEGACVIVADLDLEKAQAAAAELGSTDVAIGVAANVAEADAIQAAFDEAVLAFGGVDLVVNNAGLSLSKPLLETTEKDWDLQHDVMAKGSFLVSKAAARILIAQKLGGDIIYISSKNSVFAGPNNIAYSATKADQAHQVRLLAVELGEHGVRVRYLHSDVDTLRRVELLSELRAGVYDVLVGINLLREGLDLPEVSLVSILDADKEGFLRSGTSLIQTIGRAARNVSGQVHMYADTVTDSMRAAIDETDRRRERQIAYNKEHGIDPQPLRKKIADITDALIREGADTKAMLNRKDAAASKNGKGKSPTPNLRREGIAAEGATQLEAMISDLSDQMLAAAGELKFELAARLRDELQDLKKELRAMERAGHA